MKKGSGVLLHISSLPGHGIGSLGKQAFHFVDRLHEAGFSYWQILPLNPTSPYCGNSPYSSNSLIAGNRYFINLDQFVSFGWLEQSDLEMPVKDRVDYEAVDKHRKVVLKKAFDNATDEVKKQVAVWAKQNESIYTYALYSAFASKFGTPWTIWPQGLKDCDKKAIKKYAKECSDKIDQFLFEQYFFFTQFAELKKYANDKGIKIIGDMPVYASFDSADVWANQKLFEVEGYKTNLCAGVPPDYFSKTGQLWGNPVYKIAEHKKTGYKWMLDRFLMAQKFCDVLRVDHFRGYESFWAVEAGEKTAINGKWVKSFGKELFDKLGEVSDVEIIAEDLGIITPEVEKLMKDLDYPGMNILLFAYNSENSKYLPKNHLKNSVSYIGTHDNDTLVGWLNKVTGWEKENMIEQTGYDGDYNVFFDELFASESNVVIVSMQDMLGLDTTYRMNVPSVPNGNWSYQMKDGEFSDELVEQFAKLNEKYGR